MVDYSLQRQWKMCSYQCRLLPSQLVSLELSSSEPLMSRPVTISACTRDCLGNMDEVFMYSPHSGVVWLHSLCKKLVFVA